MHKSFNCNYLFNVTLSAIAIIFAVTTAKTRPQIPTLRYNSEAHDYEGTKGNI
ncbi:MAG: hypothetical protein RM022_015890 [Nostoc sp. EfeVER01]|uniref:hypothetical protein n=1 Tax=Nostoc sp. EfeVER01 TaxID=3075406 RepID=UPI00391A1FB1